MANLIQVTNAESGEPIIINADHIVTISPEDGDDQRSRIGTVTGFGFIKVREDMHTVAKRIQAQP